MSSVGTVRPELIAPDVTSKRGITSPLIDESKLQDCHWWFLDKFANSSCIKRLKSKEDASSIVTLDVLRSEELTLIKPAAEKSLDPQLSRCFNYEMRPLSYSIAVQQWSRCHAKDPFRSYSSNEILLTDSSVPVQRGPTNSWAKQLQPSETCTPLRPSERFGSPLTATTKPMAPATPKMTN